MRRYSVPMVAQSVVAAKDLLYIAAPATMVLCILRAEVGQDDGSGGVTSSEQSRWQLYRVSTTNTGTAITPAPMEVGDVPATFTASYLPASDNTISGLPLKNRSFNWVTGDEWVPAPEERIWVQPSGVVVMRLVDVPLSSKRVSATLTVMEIG